MKAVIAIATVFCAGLIALAIFLTSQHALQGPRLIPLDQSFLNRENQNGWVKGPLAAKVEILEFADFQCTGCAAIAPMLNEIVAARPNTVKLRFRSYPLEKHNKAHLAAQAAEAAGRQGKFWELHDMLYANQQNWNELTVNAFKDQLITYTTGLGINEEQFRRDLDDDSINDIIDKDIEAGDNLKIEATPTVFINRKLVTSIPTNKNDFLKLVDSIAQP